LRNLRLVSRKETATSLWGGVRVSVYNSKAKTVFGSGGYYKIRGNRKWGGEKRGRCEGEDCVGGLGMWDEYRGNTPLKKCNSKEALIDWASRSSKKSLRVGNAI